MRRCITLTALAAAVALVNRATFAADAALSPAAGRPVDFHKEIVPILSNSCTKCHASAQQKGGFSINTRETLLKGGDSGPAVVVGKSVDSRLVHLVAGLEPDTVMPAQGPRLSPAQIG